MMIKEGKKKDQEIMRREKEHEGDPQPDDCEDM